MDISQHLQQIPDWSGLNAYERAKHCCQLLHTLGQPIPSWMQIRQWIGKGSANDIHRAKQDFLLDRQQVLPTLIRQTDLPPALTGSLQDWWQQLKQSAEQDYSAEKQQWQQERAEQQAALEQALGLVQQQQQQLEQLKQQLEDVQQQHKQALQHAAIQQQQLDLKTEQQQQLLGLFESQQASYLCEQQRLRAEQSAIQDSATQQLGLQLKLLADFHGFAAQQIDQARQQQARLQQQHDQLNHERQQGLFEQLQQLRLGMQRLAEQQDKQAKPQAPLIQNRRRNSHSKRANLR